MCSNCENLGKYYYQFHDKRKICNKKKVTVKQLRDEGQSQHVIFEF